MDILKVMKTFFKKNSTQILTGVGVAGYAVSMYLSVKAYEECKERLSKRCEELNVEKLPAGEIAKTIWKPCILPVLTFTSSTVCVLGAQNILIKKNAALLTAYKTSETAYAEFQRQTKEKVGEEAFNQIREKVAEKQMDTEKAPDRKTYLDDARELYYDGTYGGYFYATELEIYKAFEQTRNDIEWANNTALGKNYHQMVPLGDLYYRLHGEPIGIGDDFGYDIEEYRINKLDYQISNDYKLAPNGKHALVIFYDKATPIE